MKGAGKHFQAGADLSFLDHLRTVSPEENREFSRRTVAAIRGLQLFPRPTIALIQGGCFGGGVGIAAACDIAVAAEDAMFALAEVRWGITPAPIIPLLTERIGARAAGRLALTGERFDAAMALRIGLVHEICPASELDDVGERFIEHFLMAYGPEAVAITEATDRRSHRDAVQGRVSRPHRRGSRLAAAQPGSRRGARQAFSREAQAALVPGSRGAAMTGRVIGIIGGERALPH